MSGFEIVGCGSYENYGPAVHLGSAATGGSYLPAFHITNGHIQFLTDGIRLTNLSAVKVEKVDFQHNGFNPTEGSHLILRLVLAQLLRDARLPEKNRLMAARRAYW